MPDDEVRFLQERSTVLRLSVALHASLLHELPDERGVLRGKVSVLFATSAVDCAQSDAGHEPGGSAVARAEHSAIHIEHVPGDEHGERRGGRETAGGQQ